MEKQKNKTPKRLVIDIHVADHRAVKILAAQNGITVKEWVIRALRKAAEEEGNEKTIKLPNMQ